MLLRAGIQNARLILRIVHGAVEVGRAVRVAPDDRVVAGGEIIRAHRDRPAQQGGELQVPVAVQAGGRRASGRVFGGEGRDDVLLELPLEVERIEGHTERLADGARILDALQPAAGARSVRDRARLIAAIEAHRDADDLIPGVAHQQSGHGAIDAAAHRHDDLLFFSRREWRDRGARRDGGNVVGSGGNRTHGCAVSLWSGSSNSPASAWKTAGKRCMASQCSPLYHAAVARQSASAMLLVLTCDHATMLRINGRASPRRGRNLVHRVSIRATHAPTRITQTHREGRG